MVRVFMAALALMLTAGIAAAQDLYKVKPGDVLQIEVLEDQSLNRNVLVLPDGTISVPLVGSVAAGGRTLGEVQSAIVSGLTPNFATAPNVFVNVSSLAARKTTGSRQIDVYIMGEVTNPGKIQVARGTSLLQFLAEAGGFTKFAATKRIQLRRTDSRTGKVNVYGFNYKAVENGSAGGNSIVLTDGDVVVVPERRLFE